MKMKKEYLILLVLIAALSLYLGLRKTDRTNYALPEVPKVPRASVSKIEISKGDRAIVLNREAAGWRIGPEGYTADASKVNGLLESIENLTLTALVSESKDYSRYDLGEESRVRVRAWAADDLKRDFEVGKAAPTFRHTFVKLAGDGHVYHAAENFRSKFDQTVDDLRDKAVLSFSQDEIKGITIVKGDQSLALAKQEPAPDTKAQEGEKGKGSPPPKAQPGWKTADGKEVNTEELNRMLGDLSALRCEKYLAGAKADLKDPICEVALKGQKEYRISIFAKKEKDAKTYPAVSSENEYPFLLQDWRVEKLMKDPAEWLLKSAPAEKKADK